MSPKEKTGQKQAIRGDIIRMAFYRLDILGPTVGEALIKDIEKYGIILDNNHYHSLSEIEKYLEAVFGEDAAQLLIKIIRRKRHMPQNELQTK